MENLKDKEEVIKFAQKLNSTNLSPLRSGNVSLRVIQNNVEGFLLTPSGIKYETLKPEDIVFLALKEKYDNLKMFNSSLNPSSEWRFHQDIYIEKPKAKAIVHAHSLHATAVSAFGKAIPAFHYMVALAAYDNNIPFYVALPSSTIDWNIKDFKNIPIEERNSEELSHVEGIDQYGKVKKVMIYPEKSKAMNLAFDITPAKYVTGLITEKGVCEASTKGLKKLFKRL